MSTVTFQILGNLRAWIEQREVDLGPPKQRAVLAVLLLNANEIVATDRLIDSIWGDAPPRTADHSIQIYVSELRKALSVGHNRELIETRPPGYVLNVNPEAIDARRFERMVRDGLATSRSGQVGHGSGALESAMEMWAMPLADFAYDDFAQGFIRSLVELRSDAIEALAQIHLDAGDVDRAKEYARLAIDDDPFREGPRRLLMLCLYRSGRQAEALREFTAFRGLLAEELGLEPSEAILDLEERILLRDPGLLGQSVTSRSEGNPYQGLRSFSEDSAGVFFGRETLVATILSRVEDGDGMVSIVGPSGSGKSSAAVAGVVPALRNSGSGVAVIEPGSAPLWELAGALDRAGFGARSTLIRKFESDPDTLRSTVSRPLVLVVDQFEQVFTLADQGDRARFCELLVRAVRDEGCPLQVLTTLRADYYDRPLSVPGLADVFSSSVVSVPPMTPDELERTVVEPARIAGTSVDSDLLAQLVADMVKEPGGLPLLQHALFELYDMSPERLTLEAYRSIGGLQGAVARRADEVIKELDPGEQDLVEQVFMRLVQKGRPITTSRRAGLREILELTTDPIELQNVLEAFGSSRLLTFDRDAAGMAVVEIAHEYLLMEWPQLRDWLEDHDEDLDRLRTIMLATSEWEAAGRSDDYLLRGDRLGELEAWSGKESLRLTRSESAFVEASTELRDRERRENEERHSREAALARRARRRLWAFGIAVAALTAAVTALVAILIPEPPPDLVVLYDGPDAGPIGEMIHSGLDRARDDFGLEIEEIYGTGSLTAPVVDAIDRGAPLVMLEALAADVPPVRDLLGANPETKFVMIDCMPGSAWPDNATCITARYLEMGYVAGVASGLASANRSVGFIGGADIPVIHQLQAGFEQGVRFVDPAITVNSGYLTGWNGLEFDLSGFASVTLAELLANIQIGQGADVLFPAAGGSAWGAFRAAGRAAESGEDIWVLGVDFDMIESFGEYLELLELDRDVGALDQSRILTSVLKRLDTGVYEAVSQYAANGQIAPIELTMANGGIGYTTRGGRLDPWAAELDAAISAVTGGDVVLDLDRRQRTVLLSDLMGRGTGG